MNEKLKQTFIDYWDKIIEMIPNFGVAFLVFLAFFLIGRLIFKIIQKRFAAKWDETLVTNFAANALKWLFYFIGIFAALDILNLGGIVSGLMAGAGITAIILGFAFKDIGENFLAGILLAVNLPFRIGNIIEVEGNKGVVKGMDMRSIHIRNVEGKDIYIPNAMIVKNVVINYTKDGLLRQEFMVGLDIPSDVAAAKKLILGYLSQQNDILSQPAPNVITTEIGEFTLNVKVLFWVDILKNKAQSPSLLGITIRSRIIATVKKLLLENGFNLPSKILEHKNYDASLQIKLENEP